MNESLATCQMIHGPHHKQTLLVQDELARLYIRTDRNAVSYLIVISFLVGQFLCSFRTFLGMVCFIQFFCKYPVLCIIISSLIDQFKNKSFRFGLIILLRIKEFSNCSIVPHHVVCFFCWRGGGGEREHRI